MPITLLFVPCNWLAIVQKSQELFFQYGFPSFFKGRFPHNTLTWCLPSKSQSIVFYLKLKIWWENHGTCIPLWDLVGPEFTESAFSIDSTRYSNFYFFNSTYFVFFVHQGVNIDSLIPEATFSFLIVSKYDLYIGIGILRSQKWQKWF